MSTNYYVRVPACENACKHCGRADEIHLGQSASGWRFLHQAFRQPHRIPVAVEAPVQDRASWLALLDLGDIYDEYGDRHTRDELLAWIEKQQAKRPRIQHNDDYFTVDGYDFSEGDFT